MFIIQVKKALPASQKLPEEKMLSYMKISCLHYFIFLSSIYASQMIQFNLFPNYSKWKHFTHILLSFTSFCIIMLIRSVHVGTC